MRLPRDPAVAAAAAARPSGAPVEILFFGSIKTYKGVDVLVRAGLELARRRRDFKIRIAGKPFFDMKPLEAEVAAAGAAELIEFDRLPHARPPSVPGSRPPTSSSFPYREIDASGFACASQFGKPIVASASSACSPSLWSATISSWCRRKTRERWRTRSRR